jgi:nickel/cobalt exporter
MSLTAAPLLAVIGFGLSHGVNPSHGWPVALLYSMRTTRPLLYGIITSSIIAGAHLMSSISVVLAYILVVDLMDIQIPQLYLKYGAAAALAILAYVFWKEKGEDLVETQHGHLHDRKENSELVHQHVHKHSRVGYHSHIHSHKERAVPTLKSIISFAFVSGFVHEEELVLLALAASQSIDPILLMMVYALSVSAALISVTMICLRVYQRFQYALIRYSKYLPKITSILLAFMSVGIAVGIL